jgi:ABC-2 type transport system permease protein
MTQSAKGPAAVAAVAGDEGDEADPSRASIRVERRGGATVGQPVTMSVDLPEVPEGASYNFTWSTLGDFASNMFLSNHPTIENCFTFLPPRAGSYELSCEVVEPGEKVGSEANQTVRGTLTVADGWAKRAWNTPAKRDGFILRQLVGKDFKLKYRRSVLGVLWSVLNPLLMMCVMALVFSSFMKVGSDTVKCFPLYLIIGNTVFQVMTDSTNQGMSSIINAASLLKKVKINRYVFPIEKVLFACVNFAFSMIAVIIVMLWFQIAPTATIVLFPLALLYLMVFCAGLSLALSALSVFFRDVMHLWGVVVTAWTYLTPLFYTISILPDFMQRFEMFNPMYHYVTYFRDILLNGVWPSLHANLICAGCAVGALLIGYLIFRKNEHRFILYI